MKAVRAGSSLGEALRAAYGQQPDGAREFVLQAILGGEAFDRADWDTARTHLDAALASRAHLADVLPGLYYTQALLAERRGDRPALERAARATIDASSRLALPSGWSLPARELLEEATR